MVNGNYILYGDRPSSESEIVDDHVHRGLDRKPRRKANRTANELQQSLNIAQLDNETDSVKCEKKVKEPRLLRYVPTSDVEENYVSEKFETYDLKPTEERPRRYTFTKKPKNLADGSVNYAYSRSSSSCSSPNGNLPTISEHVEQYGTYRVRSLNPTVEDLMGYETKFDKYFAKPRDVKPFALKGSHPDSLYRVPTDSSVGIGKMERALRMIRWPLALLSVCVALAVFVYFIMPDNFDAGMNGVNGTYSGPETIALGAAPQEGLNKTAQESHIDNSSGTKTAEMDFYDNRSDKESDIISVTDSIPNTMPQRKLPIPPVFPSHITPEVQYGNEQADTEKLRSPKVLETMNTLPDDSTLKPHITLKPEKPLAIYFKHDNDATSSTTENVIKTYNDAPNFDVELTREQALNYQQYVEQKTQAIPTIHPVYEESDVKAINRLNFTSGHSNLFGISIEDAATMKSTTQSSVYNTRVSPTLPTWHDRDDSTTKKYPTNVYTDVPHCGSTRFSLCRGVLPYDLAGPPAVVGGLDITSLLPQIDYMMSTNCSDRIRHFVCPLLEPECSPPPYPPKLPCYNLCKAIVDNCDGQIPRELHEAFHCHKYSKSNCIAAKSPCYTREFACGDGSCVPRDWICDGRNDCPGGEDEGSCVQCTRDEFRCSSGNCILKRWLCDGFADCSNGEDEDEQRCGPIDEHVVGDTRGELGEELAGSAPAPSVRRPNKLQHGKHRSDVQRTGESDSSKELLMTSDSNHAFKRNFTRRPSIARLSQYSRPTGTTKKTDLAKDDEPVQTTPKDNESMEGVNIGDFLAEMESPKKIMGVAPPPPRSQNRAKHQLQTSEQKMKMMENKFERVIDGAALLKKAAAADALTMPDKNSTTIDKEDISAPEGSMTAHASPCPSGELRCVDGRCITLAQLCDGTIHCSDHADEDNCFT